MFVFRKRNRKTVILVCFIVITAVVILVFIFSTSTHSTDSSLNPAIFADFPTNWVYKTRDHLTHNAMVGLEMISSDQRVFIGQHLSFQEVETNFFKYLETKDVICHGDQRIGNQHDGGWNVCLSPPFIIKLKKPCLVYSFGIGDDWRFEDAMCDNYGCQVMAYDPSIHVKEHNRTKLIWFKPLGLAHKTFVTENKWRLKTLRQHLLDEHHSKTIIDFLKFDIEFMEWPVLQSMLMDSSLHNVKQLAFEMHLKHPTQTPSKQLYITKSDFLEKFEVLKLLEDSGFKKFNYRLNPFCGYISNVTQRVRSRCYELHYLNMRFVGKHHLIKGKKNKMSMLA